MKFLYRKYAAKKGEVIEVAPSAPSTVKFMTAAEFRKYSAGRTHTYYKGRAEDDLIRIVLPFDSVWHAVVEKQADGLAATCKLRPPLPERARPVPHGEDLAAIANDELEGLSRANQSEG